MLINWFRRVCQQSISAHLNVCEATVFCDFQNQKKNIMKMQIREEARSLWIHDTAQPTHINTTVKIVKTHLHPRTEENHRKNRK